MTVAITDEQRANLRVLSTFLRTNANRIDFSMRNFARDKVSHYSLDLNQIDADHPCGSVCCAIGFGPAAGLLPIEADEADWVTYAGRVFGVENTYYDGAFGPLWNGLFDSDWAQVDNTALGAANRIDHFLDTGELTEAGKVYRPHLSPSADY